MRKAKTLEQQHTEHIFKHFTHTFLDTHIIHVAQLMQYCTT